MKAFFAALRKPAIVLSCMFPFFMLFVEWLFRISSNTSVAVASAASTTGGAVDFFGPSLAAAGLGFLVPLTAPKPSKVKVNTDKLGVHADQIIIRDTRDETFSHFVWVAILAFLAIWMGTLQISVHRPALAFLGLAVHIWLGLISYFVGVILTCVKEAI